MGHNTIKNLGVFCILLIVIGTAVYFFSTNGNDKEQIHTSGAAVSQDQDNEGSLPSSPDGETGDGLMQEMQAAVNDSDPGQRIKAILALRNIKTEASIRTLQQFLNDDNHAVVEEAIDALLSIGMGSDEFKGQIFGILAAKAQDEEFSARDGALVGAARLGFDDRILPIIQSFIDRQDETGSEQSKLAAARALTFVSPDAGIDQARKLVELSDDPTINRIAYNIFSKSNSPASLEILQESVDSNDKTMQLNGVWALTRKSDPKFNAIIKEALIKNSLGKDSLSLLAQSPSAPDVFREVFSTDEVPKDNQLVYLKALEKHAINAPNEVRRGLKTAVEPLLDSDDRSIQLQAIKTLGRIGGGIDTAEVLRPKLQSEDSEIRREAVIAYASYTTPHNYKPLLDLLWDDDKMVRESVLVFTARFLNDSDRGVLEKALKSEDEVVRKQAESILKSRTSEE